MIERNLRHVTNRRYATAFFEAFGMLPLTYFGAVGDNVTDNYANIQVAINESIKRGLYYIFVPQGKFYYTGVLLNVDNITFLGNKEFAKIYNEKGEEIEIEQFGLSARVTQLIDTAIEKAKQEQNQSMTQTLEQIKQEIETSVTSQVETILGEHIPTLKEEVKQDIRQEIDIETDSKIEQIRDETSTRIQEMRSTVDQNETDIMRLRSDVDTLQSSGVGGGTQSESGETTFRDIYKGTRVLSIPLTTVRNPRKAVLVIKTDPGNGEYLYRTVEITNYETWKAWLDNGGYCTAMWIDPIESTSMRVRIYVNDIILGEDKIDINITIPNSMDGKMPPDIICIQWGVEK